MDHRKSNSHNVETDTEQDDGMKYSIGAKRIRPATRSESSSHSVGIMKEVEKLRMGSWPCSWCSLSVDHCSVQGEAEFDGHESVIDAKQDDAYSKPLTSMPIHLSLICSHVPR